MTVRKKRNNEKSRVGVTKERKNSASTIVSIPPDTKAIIEDEIPDENNNESASDEFENNLNSST